MTPVLVKSVSILGVYRFSELRRNRRCLMPERCYLHSTVHDRVVRLLGVRGVGMVRKHYFRGADVVDRAILAIEALQTRGIL